MHLAHGIRAQVHSLLTDQVKFVIHFSMSHVAGSVLKKSLVIVKGKLGVDDKSMIIWKYMLGLQFHNLLFYF